MSNGGRRKSTLTSLLSFKSNPCKGTSKNYGKQKSVSSQTLETPSRDVRKISLQNDALLKSSRTAEPAKELDKTSSELVKENDKSSAVNSNVPLNVKKEILQPNNDTENLNLSFTDINTPRTHNETSSDKPLLKHQNNVEPNDFESSTNNERNSNKKFHNTETEPPTTPTSPTSQVIMR